MNDVILRKRPYITWQNTSAGQRNMLGKLIKLLFYLVILAFIGVVGYAYLGPWFGSDFTAPQNEIRVPVTLDAN